MSPISSKGNETVLLRNLFEKQAMSPVSPCLGANAEESAPRTTFNRARPVRAIEKGRRARATIANCYHCVLTAFGHAICWQWWGTQLATKFPTIFRATVGSKTVGNRAKLTLQSLILLYPNLIPPHLPY